MVEAFLVLLAAGVMLAVLISNSQGVTVNWMRVGGGISLTMVGVLVFFFTRRAGAGEGGGVGVEWGGVGGVCGWGVGGVLGFFYRGRGGGGKEVDWVLFGVVRVGWLGLVGGIHMPVRAMGKPFGLGAFVGGVLLGAGMLR